MHAALSPHTKLQVRLYEDFARSKAKKEVEDTLLEEGEEEEGEGEEMESLTDAKVEAPTTHIFQVR